MSVKARLGSQLIQISISGTDLDVLMKTGLVALPFYDQKDLVAVGQVWVTVSETVAEYIHMKVTAERKGYEQRRFEFWRDNPDYQNKPRRKGKGRNA